MGLLTGLLAGALALALIMAGAWQVQRMTGNSGWIDTIWTFGTGAVACALALAPLNGTASFDWRQWLAAILAACWSLRLGGHILARTRKVPDDPRYRAMMESWGPDGPKRLFLFLQAQAAVALLLVGAVMLAAHHPEPSFRWLDAVAFVVFALGIVGEGLADAQLRRFKQTAAPHTVCDKGLWSWSRHPNYFCEWLCWCSFPLLAIGSTFAPGWLALLAPLFMYWTLVYASGIPPLEAHMRRTRPEAFAAYSRRTNAFVPAPPRRD